MPVFVRRFRGLEESGADITDAMNENKKKQLPNYHDVELVIMCITVIYLSFSFGLYMLSNAISRANNDRFLSLESCYLSAPPTKLEVCEEVQAC